MINKILCWLGFHNWKTISENQYLTTGERIDQCTRCFVETRRIFWHGVEM